MKTYLIILAIVFSIMIISGIVNLIAEKKNSKSFTFELSNLIATGFGMISVLMFFGGLLWVFC